MSDDLVKQASYVLREQGVDETAAKLRRLGEANEKTAAQAEILTRQQTLQDASSTRLGAKLEGLARKYDPVYRAQAEAQRLERTIAAAEKGGVAVPEAATRALEIAKQRHADLVDPKAIDNATDSVARFRKQVDRVEAFAWNNTGFSGNEIERVTMPIRALAGAIGVIPTVAVAGFAAVGAAMLAIEMRAHNISVAARQLADDLSLSGQVNASGAIGAGGQQYAEQLTKMSSAWDVVGKGASLSTDEVRKFGAEVAKLPAVTAESAAGLGDLARAERYAFGSEGVDMIQNLVAALRQPDQALQNLISNNLGLTAAQRQMAQSALEGGNSQKQASAYFRIVTDDLIKQKTEAALVDAAHHSLSGATREVAQEALDAARSSGDFEGALERLAATGSDAARRLLGVVSSIRSVRAELARGLSGVELTNQLQNINDKLYPLHTTVRQADAQFEGSARQVRDLETGIANAEANLRRIKVAGEEGSAEFKRGVSDIEALNGQLTLAKSNAAAYDAARRKAAEAVEGGSSYDRSKKNIDAAHDVDKDEVARSRETIAALAAQRADLERSNVASSEDGAAKIREIDQSLKDEEVKLADERLKVQVARIDAEIAKEEQGSEKKKQLARQKFEVETRGMSPDSAEAIGKKSEMQSVLDEEPTKSGKGRSGSSHESLDQVDRLFQSLEKENASLRGEADAIGKSNVEREKSIDLAKAEEAAKERGAALTEEERVKVLAFAEAHATLRQKVDGARKAQDEAEAARKQFADMGESSVERLIVEHQKLADVLKEVVKELEKMALKAVLTGQGPLAGLFGTAGQNGAAGGLFGLLGSGGQSLFSGLFSNANFAGQAAGAIGPFPQAEGGGGLLGFLGGLFGFANGGLITMAHLPRYAGGGPVAPDGGFPILAHPGEVILNAAQQRNVAGGLGGQGSKIVFENHAPGVTVQPAYATHGEVRYMIQSEVAANNGRQSLAPLQAW
ncbi:hypothetical+protein [Methylocapsa aurea]|uniref:hypothetical protein n=1 Tax=Methylocapsa aurea TaxID=663610 RepID=UPI003D18F581